jgi:DNA-binding NarL/FixJ family response regulator
MPITVAIVEDDPETRENLILLLGEAKGLKCLGAFATGEDALQGIPLKKPEVALVDINLPGMNGIECVTKLKALMPELLVLMLTTYEQHDLIFKSLRAGASGYLIKNMPPEELIEAFEQVHAGGAPMSMQVTRAVVDYFHKTEKSASDLEKLTQQEQKILSLMAKGFLYKEIANQLGIAFHTVRAHVRSIYEKLHIQSRAQASMKFLGRNNPPN